jgi:hypothetical protein
MVVEMRDARLDQVGRSLTFAESHVRCNNWQIIPRYTRESIINLSRCGDGKSLGQNNICTVCYLYSIAYLLRQCSAAFYHRRRFVIKKSRHFLREEKHLLYSLRYFFSLRSCLSTETTI